MVQAIIFDCFGVLATEGWIAFKQEHFGENPEKMRRATELSHMLDAGRIAYQDSLKEIAEMAGVSRQGLDNTLKNVAANKELLGYIHNELKPKYKIGMLSNVGDNWLYSIFEPGEIALFDAISLSHEVGVTKPDPRAYAVIVEKLSVPIESCVFVDDLERNVTGAQEVGMQAVLYKDFSQMKDELDVILNPLPSS